MNRWRRLSVTDRRYALLALALLLMGVYNASKQRWGLGYDIWEHAATVQELMRSPLSPEHPLLPLDAPHQFMSPYLLGVALAGKLLGIAATTALALAGVVNLALLIVGTKMLVDRLVGRSHAAFWALVFTVVLWGATPWVYSGFFHADALFVTLPYPAAFSRGLVLIALAVHLDVLGGASVRRLGIVGVLGVIVTIAHPMDAVFLFVGMTVFAISRDPQGMWRNVALAGLTAAIAVALALTWPYFSVVDLLLGHENEAYRRAVFSDDLNMYDQVWRRTWPAVIGLPFVVRRLSRNAADPLGLLLVMTTALYLIGAIADQRSLGRLLSYGLLLVHVALADGRADVGARVMKVDRPGGPLWTWVAATTALLIALGAYNVRQGLAQATPFAYHLRESLVRDNPDLVKWSTFDFFRRELETGDVLLGDLSGIFAAPSVSDAKVVAGFHPLAFVPSAKQRLDDTGYFFSPGVPTQERRTLLERWEVTHVLVSKGWGPDILAELEGLGERVHEDDRYVLLAVDDV